MRVLMCSPNPLVRELGAPKVLIELAEAMREVGVACDVIEPRDYGATAARADAARTERRSKLRAYLRAHAPRYDVVDYDHEELPFPRADFDPRPLMVARSVLLVRHLRTIPTADGRWGLLSRLFNYPAARRRHAAAGVTLHEADLINVSNEDDKECLIRMSCRPEKVVVLPYGLSGARREALLHGCGHDVPAGEPRVAFVGTFDARKGACDFPKIVAAVCQAVPTARFRLLGTSGRYSTEQQVRRFFPAALQKRLEIVPQFASDELPALLRDCAVGVFPSYYEGFGFGVLEMLAAAIPVIAYAAPGPPMMLPADWLVRPGDVGAMSTKLVALLRDRDALGRERVRARERSKPFDWSDIARRTIDAYEAAIARRAAGR